METRLRGHSTGGRDGGGGGGGGGSCHVLPISHGCLA